MCVPKKVYYFNLDVDVPVNCAVSPEPTFVNAYPVTQHMNTGRKAL